MYKNQERLAAKLQEYWEALGAALGIDQCVVDVVLLKDRCRIVDVNRKIEYLIGHN